eukprot:5626751-Amphidinium_carterae.1
MGMKRCGLVSMQKARWHDASKYCNFAALHGSCIPICMLSEGHLGSQTFPATFNVAVCKKQAAGDATKIAMLSQSHDWYSSAWLLDSLKHLARGSSVPRKRDCVLACSQARPSPSTPMAAKRVKASEQFAL